MAREARPSEDSVAAPTGDRSGSLGLCLACKLAAVVVAVGVTALMLLGLRHSRLVEARDLANARLDIRAIDEQVAAVRASIAQRVHPDAVEALVARIDAELGPLEPIVLEPFDERQLDEPIDTESAL